MEGTVNRLLLMRKNTEHAAENSFLNLQGLYAEFTPFLKYLLTKTQISCYIFFGIRE